MRERLRLDSRVVAAWKSLAQGLVYAALVFAAVLLMMLGKANGEIAERIRIHVADAVAPLLEIMSRPVDAAVAAAQAVQGWRALQAENAALRQDRERLLRWQETAYRLQAENAHLGQLLHLVPDPPARFVTARVIADSGGAFARSVLVGAGAGDGVAKGHAVITAAGLVGRVAGVAARSSLVLLVTDLNFRAPVVIGATRTRAILAGDNSERPKIVHLDPDALVAAGDRVVTSGHANAFPADIPIGTVASVHDGVIRVQLFTENTAIDYVQIVDYGLQGIIDAVAGKTAPGRAGGATAHAGDAPAVAPRPDLRAAPSRAAGRGARP